MKKLSIALIAIFLLSLLVACGPESNPTPMTPPATPATPTTPESPTTPAQLTPPKTPPPLVMTPTEEPAKKPVTLKFSYTMPKGTSLGEGFEWFKPEFEKRTEGRYKVEMYPSSALLSIPSALEGVKNGVAEIAIASTAVTTDFPLNQVTTLPTVTMPTDTNEQRLAQWDAQWEILEAMPQLMAEYKDFKLLWPYALASNGLASMDEIRVPADLKGHKVGASGVSGEIIKAAGGAPVSLVAPQTYMNMDKGVIDAAILGNVLITDYDIETLISYFNSYPFSCGQLVLLMNQAAWNALPPEDQQIMEEVTRESAMENLYAMDRVSAASWKKFYAADRVTVIEPTAEETALWDEACQPAIDKWIENCHAVGADSAEEVLAKYREIRAKYLK